MSVLSLSTLEADVRCLYHLLDTLLDEQLDPANRERCDALLWIARDRAQALKNKIEGARHDDPTPFQ